ncbi:hypothetical protein AVEN_95225-1, partial [Araneus ventricosus]
MELKFSELYLLMIVEVRLVEDSVTEAANLFVSKEYIYSHYDNVCRR